MDPFSDLHLARRLERAEAGANAAFVEARASLQPEVRAGWTEVAGAYALFDGVGSPLTQSFGLGLFAEAGDDELLRAERFFQERGADVFHEVSPLAGVGLHASLCRRGYVPVEFTSVLFRPLPFRPGEPGAASEVRARRIEPGEEEIWARTAAGGWSSESAETAAFVAEMGRVGARSAGSFCFLAELHGQAVAAGGLNIREGVALLAGASTVPDGRRRGAQRALLEARLRFAAEQGCDLAMMGAAPGSASQRNAERQGFRIAYTRVKWHLPRERP